MEGQHHPLAAEFPEHQDKIHYLKLSDAHFKKLCERFEEVDKQIARLEARVELSSETDEGKLRKDRLKLKDEIYAYLTR